MRGHLVASLLAACGGTSDAPSDTGDTSTDDTAPTGAAGDDTTSGDDTADPNAVRVDLAVVLGGRDVLLRIDQIGGAGWSASTPQGADDLRRDGDELLISHATGGARYALEDGTETWYAAPFPSVFSAGVVETTLTVLVHWVDDDAVFTAFDPSGTIAFEGGAGGGFEQMGPVWFEADAPRGQGTAVFAAGPPWQVVLRGARPEDERRIDLPGEGDGYGAIPGPDGHVVASTGDGRVVELDPEGAVVRTWGGEAHAGVTAVRGFDLVDDRYVMAVVTREDGTGLALYDEQNTEVWRWSDPDGGTPRNVVVLGLAGPDLAWGTGAP